MADPLLAQSAIGRLQSGATPTLVRTYDALALGLPFSWLADVWSPGLTHFLGRFTLAVNAAGRRLTLDSIGTALDRSQLVIELN